MYSVFPTPDRRRQHQDRQHQDRQHPGRQHPGRQKGAALILALVVFGIVALLATSLGMDFLVSVRRAENQLYGQQAMAYMRGAEGLARQALQVDFKNDNNKKDHISEGWLNNTQQYPMDVGVVSGTLCDLQGRFNLNNLPGQQQQPGQPQGQPGQPRQYTLDQELFIRLLQTLPLEKPLDQQQAEDLASAVIDWIDPDNNVSGTGGAEEGYYSDRDPPYRPGNQFLQRVSELRWVKGMTDEIYRALEPHVTALPEATKLNVNTADLLLLRSINQHGNLAPLGEADAQNVMMERDGDVSGGDPTKMNAGFDTVDKFIDALPSKPQDAKANLDVRSDYFLLESAMLFQDRTFTLRSEMHRDSTGKITTLARGRNGLGSCSNETGGL